MSFALAEGGPLERYVRGLEAQAPRSGVGLEPDLSLGDAADHEAALFGWAARIVDEHASVIRFSELLSRLAVLGAPYPMLATVERLIADELRHVRLCAELAAAFGDLDSLELDLEGLALPPTEESDGSRALAIIVRELVVGERESLVALVAYRDATTDPAVRHAYDRLVHDEALHASAGRHLEQALRRFLPREAMEPFFGIRDAMAGADARSMRAAYRASAGGGPGRVYGVSIEAHELAFEPERSPCSAGAPCRP